MIPVGLGVVLIVFTISYLTPGDPIMTILGVNYTPETYEAKLVELGLDKPFFVQYFKYIFNMVTKLDLGNHICQIFLCQSNWRQGSLLLSV
jgi:peptide/nickel transport system permease protein